MTEFEKSILSDLTYDPSTGQMRRTRRKNRWGYFPVDELVGTSRNGYMKATFLGKELAVHRAAFLFMNGSLPSRSFDVDHINGIRYDNRWVNLRLASRSQNNMNSAAPCNNTSGHKGVHLDRRIYKKGAPKKPWFARIKISGKTLHLGFFKTFEEAVEVRRQAEEKYFGEFKRFT